ncbi:MAG: DUF4157 domain-containing protein [Pseudomonadota bacterium]
MKATVAKPDGAAGTGQRLPARPTAHRSPAALSPGQPRLQRMAETEADEPAGMETMEDAEPMLQRACACGGGCPSCQSGGAPQLDRHPLPGAARQAGVAPVSVAQTLSRPGRPLDGATRAALEPRFGRDFSRVRVHTDAEAGRSAQEVNALAYTVGQSIVFAPGQYRPDSDTGRALLGHELAHTVQQSGTRPLNPSEPVRIADESSAAEHEAREIGARIGGGGSVKPGMQPAPAPHRLARADPEAVGRIEALSITPGSAMQFIPQEITDTVVGPPPPGGWQGDRMNRLNVVIGENMTPRILARQLLPLWTTATPFTPQGSATANALTLIDEETLAKGLMVYNRFYLGLPNMAQWQAGLRFPLPIALAPDPNDASRIIGTLHPDVIVSLAGTYDAAWNNLLDQGATALVAQGAPAQDAAAAAFLGQHSSMMARGMALAHRALTNMPETFALYLALNRQLNQDQRFELVLAILDAMVNRQVDILASQTEGVLFIWEMAGEMANAPASPSAELQARIDRTNLMLNRPTLRLIDTPASRRTRAEKTITVDTMKMDGSTQNPATQIAVANAIFAQCNIRVVQGVDATATAAETTAWLGQDKTLRTSSSCASVTSEERRMVTNSRATYNIATNRFRAYFVMDAVGFSALGWSCTASSAHPLNRGLIVVLNTGWGDTLAHEIGHHLLNPGSHRSTGTILESPGPRTRVGITDAQCDRMYRRA